MYQKIRKTTDGGGGQKILVIGAGINQLPIIQTAKSLGYYVIAASVKGDYPGFQAADECIYEDIFNVDALTEQARLHKVIGVISDQSDMAAPITARIAEALNLPTYGYENALRYTDKTKMRAVFEAAGLPTPRYFSVDTLESALNNAKILGYPLVIKPADSFSSRGVFIIHDESELRSMFGISMQFSRSKKVIQEEYISGKQYFCQGYIDNYKLRVYAFSDRYYFKLPNAAIPYTNAFPARIDDALQNRMTEYFQRIADYTRPRFGQAWVEWIHDDKKDVLYPVEMAIRGAGAHVTTELIPYAYGIDSQPYLVRACTGDFSKPFADEKIVPKAAAFYCFLLPAGKVVRVSGLDRIKEIPGVMKSYVQEIHEGDIIAPPADKSSRFGPIITAGETRDDIDRTWENLKRTVRIDVETPEGIKGAIWE